MRWRWLHAPAVHFAALGALVFVAGTWRGEGAAPAPAGAAAPTDQELLESEARRLGLDRDDSAVRRRLLRNLRFLGEGSPGDEEADYEEVLALGLDRSDLVVRRRLVQRLELRALAWARATEPSDAELAELLAREQERFALPARVRLTQVFLSRDRHGAGLAAADRALAKQLASLPPELALRLGDPFLLGSQLPPRTHAELAGSFGAGFAGAVAGLSQGRWSGPIASSYGLHRVYVQERIPGRPARLEEVRSALREAVFAERAEAVLADWLRRLRGEAV
ncbi:MAG: peptidyl-prolyl cis-trans isomerase [Candidatus Limnocylindria bacterium]